MARAARGPAAAWAEEEASEALATICPAGASAAVSAVRPRPLIQAWAYSIQ